MLVKTHILFPNLIDVIPLSLCIQTNGVSLHQVHNSGKAPEPLTALGYLTAMVFEEMLSPLCPSEDS